MPPRLTVSEVQQSACHNESFLLTLVGDKSFSLITEPLIAAIPCLVRKGQKLSRLGAALNSLSVLVVHIFFFFVFLPSSCEKRRNSSSWKISPHSLNIWTAFYSVCRRGRVLGSSWAAALWGTELSRWAEREGGPPRWEVVVLGAVWEWVFRRGCRRDLFVYFVTVNSRSL